MKVKEAASRLEISVSLCYALVASGKLRATRHGLARGCIRISEEQLQDYVERIGDTMATDGQPFKWIT